MTATCYKKNFGGEQQNAGKVNGANKKQPEEHFAAKQVN